MLVKRKKSLKFDIVSPFLIIRFGKYCRRSQALGHRRKSGGSDSYEWLISQWKVPYG